MENAPVYYLLINKERIDVTALGVFSIGREGDIKVSGDLSVSRKHCIIALPKKWPKNDTAWIFDTSKNGCLLNGNFFIAKANQERACRLYSGDIVQIGKTNIQFLIDNESLPDPLGTLT